MVNVDTTFAGIVSYIKGCGGVIIGAVYRMDGKPTIGAWLGSWRDSTTIAFKFCTEIKAPDDFITLRVVAHTILI